MALNFIFTLVFALVLSSYFPGSMFTTGCQKQRFTQKPAKPTHVYIGSNVSLEWRYCQPSHVKLSEVAFGLWTTSPGFLSTKLVAIHRSGSVQVRGGYASLVSWAGNLTSSHAVFVLYRVQSSDKNKVFGIHVEYSGHNSPLIDTVQLQVETKPIADLPRITYVTTPPLVRIGQNVSLNCTASSISPVNVTWYKGNKVLTGGMSEAVLTLKIITDKDWGEFLCVAKNSAGVDKKSVILKVLPESPTILTTNKKVHNASWTLQWSPVYSEGHLVMLYTVWHTKDTTTREKPWLRENVTRLLYRKELTADTSYLFAVTAWNRWGESLLERDKILSISTDFPARIKQKTDKTIAFFHTDTKASIPPSSASSYKKNYVSGSSTEVTLYTTLSVGLCMLTLVAGAIFLKRRKRSKEKNTRHHGKDLQETTPYSFTLHEDFTSDEDQETANEVRSTILAESPLSIPESSLTLGQPTTLVRDMQETCNQSRTADCFVLAAVQSEAITRTPNSSSQAAPSPLTTFAPHRGSERSEQNQDINMVEIKPISSEEQNENVMEMNEGSVQQRNEGTRKIQAFDAHGQNRVVTDAIQNSAYSEDYLQPVDSNNLQVAIKNTDSFRLSPGKAQTLNRPQPKPRMKKPDKSFPFKHPTFTRTLSKLQFTEMLKSTPLHGAEAAQHCTRVKSPDQSNHLIPKVRTCHAKQHGYQNEQFTATPYQNSLRPAGSVESPYTRVLYNTNWEVPRDHLSLFERIGGGSFGQVWKGAVLDVAGAQGWSIVAVKMLKENASNSDLKDLLSELNLLKKLKPHPNVIQLKGCLTKDVIRCKEKRDFRPPFVILEFVPHGDLLGYLKKSKGETDDYYNLRGADVPQKIPTQQLYKFASDIARGMEFISAHQLIHRDLAARNVLVGEGLRCKITDFGMARDLGQREIYVRRSNGLMPVKWMAVESLTSQVYTTESDVWSYGIVLYEIFTLGERPYDGMTGEEVFQYVASGHRLPRTPAMGSELYNLMLQCWQEEPSKRPAFSEVASWTEAVAQATDTTEKTTSVCSTTLCGS